MKSFGAIIWFALCFTMALGMVFFAVLYGLVSFMLKRFAWKNVSFSLPSFKFAE